MELHNAVIKSAEYFEMMNTRKSRRRFSSQPVPKEAINNLLKVFANSPSGANKQPWFVCVAESIEMKKKLRAKCEEVEYENYSRRFSDNMKDDFKPLYTNHEKPFLEEAPFVFVIFKKKYDIIEGQEVKTYYPTESTGMAVGMLISAIHYAGLSTVAYSPNPMNFMNELFERPQNESAFIVLPVGYPSDEEKLPNVPKKSVEEISKFF